eukprot:GCRY01000050.1.p1 GENE.GCRY01000050.1~~GCRY01000050.1.p1  ORF type:complete len:133 (-),score=12.26 GCRY01000050.1:208-606(-)
MQLESWNCLFLINFDVTRTDLVLNISGSLTIDSAANRVASTENFHNGAAKGGSHGAFSLTHLAGNTGHLVDGKVTVVLDVLLSLTVTDGLVEFLKNKSGGRGNDRDSSLTILDGELASHAKTLPFRLRTATV